uniref:Uncharacterized protein n=1 Tax=Anopheles atroparvus TaxID=41427 RepID=A0A182IQV2_ANOAO
MAFGPTELAGTVPPHTSAPCTDAPGSRGGKTATRLYAYGRSCRNEREGRKKGTNNAAGVAAAKRGATKLQEPSNVCSSSCSCWEVKCVRWRRWRLFFLSFLVPSVPSCWIVVPGVVPLPSSCDMPLLRFSVFTEASLMLRDTGR